MVAATLTPVALRTAFTRSNNEAFKHWLMLTARAEKPMLGLMFAGALSLAPFMAASSTLPSRPPTSRLQSCLWSSLGRSLPRAGSSAPQE